jgi:nicotinamidase-related amidase
VAKITLTGRYFKLYPPENYGYAEDVIDLDVQHTAFIICDVYGQFPSSDKKDNAPSGLEYLFKNEYDIIANRIRPSKDMAKKVGLPCIYLSNSAPRIGIEHSWFGKQRAMNIGKWHDELFSEDMIDPLEYKFGHSEYIKYAEVIKPDKDDYFIRKWVYSGFFDTRLDTLLRNLRIDTLVCTGFAGDICLLTTMIDATYHNYRVLLLRDCTQSVEIPEVDGKDFGFTKRMILWSECHIGYTATSEEFIAACKKTSSG